MKLENLKNEYPKMPEHMREMVEQEVSKQTKIISQTSHKTRGKMPWKKTVAAILAATLALTTTVLGGIKLYQWYTEKEGDYGLKAGIAVSDTAESEETVSAPQEIPVLSIEAAYLPQGMIAADDDSQKYYYESNPWKGGFSMSFITMDEELSKDNLPVSDTYVTTSEMITINDKTGIYLEKAGGSFDKKLYIAYPDYWQILEIFVGSDVTKEDALKVVENLNVTPTGETQLFSEAYTWSEMLTSDISESENIDVKLTATKDEMKNLHEVGEAFEITTAADLDDGEVTDAPLEIKVTDVTVADDLSMLEDEFMDEDLTATLDGQGKLIKNEICYIKSGDGINSIDEEIRREEVNQKLVYVTAEYTNLSNTELKDVMFFCSFIGMTESDNGYTLYNRAISDGDDTTDSIAASSAGGFGEMDYYDVHGGERGNNHIPVIQPGETVTVHIGKIINEDEMDKLYLSFDPAAAVYEVTEEALEIGYVNPQKVIGETAN